MSLCTGGIVAAKTWGACKYIPNTLSLLRLLLAVPFVLIIHDIFVYECTKNLGLVIIFFTIIGSDVADGYLARKLHCTSAAGAALDVISDAVYTVLSLAAFAYFKIIPVWFICLMVLKLLEFVVTSKLIRKQQYAEKPLIFDILGKISVSIVMLLPGIFVFRCIIIGYKTVMNILIYVITAMLLISFINRMKHALNVCGFRA
jgi:CDP-diacylglycerol--glycerol-3-phosphate 3-phosphatidyltransferase